MAPCLPARMLLLIPIIFSSFLIGESLPMTASKSTEKLKKVQAKRHTPTLPEDNSDPIPAPIVKEISDLLKITSATDQSAEIAEEIKRRKKTKKGTVQMIS